MVVLWLVFLLLVGCSGGPALRLGRQSAPVPALDPRSEVAPREISLLGFGLTIPTGRAETPNQGLASLLPRYQDLLTQPQRVLPDCEPRQIFPRLPKRDFPARPCRTAP